MQNKSFELIKNSNAIESMTRAGEFWRQLYHELMDKINPDCRPGDLFSHADNFFRKNHLLPATELADSLDENHSKFSSPVSICRGRALVHCPEGEQDNNSFKNGELVRLDFALGYMGWFVDAARTFRIQDNGSPGIIGIGREILNAGINLCRAGNELRDVIKAVNEEAKARDLKILPIFCGHGIGQSVHEWPKIPALVSLCEKVVLRSGMTLALEIVAAREAFALEKSPGQKSIRSQRATWALHEEDTILITHREPVILTRD